MNIQNDEETYKMLFWANSKFINVQKISNVAPADECRTVFQSTVKRRFCLCLQCVKMSCLLRLFYLRVFAQLHSLYALSHCGHESPPCGTMCCAVLHFLSFSSPFIYAQITKPHSNHANMLMTFVSTPIFSAPEITWICIQWLMCLCICECLLCLVSRFHTLYVLPHILSGKWQCRTDMCMCLSLVGASMFLVVVPHLLWLHLSFDFVHSFVCLFFTKARRHSIRKQFGNNGTYV